MKGIVLAGGTGSRLWPLTIGISKQLLPVYDKPLIYYPISTLMLAGIREILIITTKRDQSQFQELLGDGSNFGVTLKYAIQEAPKGLAQALTIGQDFLGDSDCLLILGDNIFHGVGLGQELRNSIPKHGAQIFTYAVSNPENYGVLTVSETGNPIAIEEKPQNPKSNLAITGLYYFDSFASQYAAEVRPSQRGELEITSVLQIYLEKEELKVTKLSRGTAWLDTGTVDSLYNAASYIRVIEQRTGLKIGCLEEIAFGFNWISESKLKENSIIGKNQYGDYLKNLVRDVNE